MTVTIGSDTFDIYGTTAGLTSYANGSLSFYATWSAASADTRSRALVEATRLLDRQPWDDAYTVEAGNADTPQDIVDACYELALAGLADVSIFATTSQRKNIQSVGAGPATVTFFAPTPGGRFPSRVMELIMPYLAGSGAANAGTIAYGTDGESQFDICDEYDVSGP